MSFSTNTIPLLLPVIYANAMAQLKTKKTNDEQITQKLQEAGYSKNGIRITKTQKQYKVEYNPQAQEIIAVYNFQVATDENGKTILVEKPITNQSNKQIRKLLEDHTGLQVYKSKQ